MSENSLIPANTHETDLVNKWIYNQWNMDLNDLNLDQGTLWVLHNSNTTDFFWISQDIQNWINKLDHPILSAGLYIGYEKQDQFFVSLPFVQRISKDLTNYQIQVTKNGVTNFVTLHSVRVKDLRIPSKTSDNIEKLVSNNPHKANFSGIIVTPNNQVIGLCKITLNLETSPYEIELTPIDTIAKYLRAGY